MYLGTAETNRRYAVALSELRARGVIHGPRPLLARVMAALGLEPRPGPYLSWRQTLLIYTIGFAIARLVVDPLLSWTTGLSFGVHIVGLVLSALFFGSIVAGLQIWRQHKLGLSAWDQL